MYPVEIVNNLFFSEESADSGRKLVQDYLQALKNGEDVSEYQKIAKSFLNTQEKVYDTQSQSANSKLASWISRNYKGVDVNSLPTENIDDLALVRVMSSPDPIGVDPYGNVVIQSTFLGNPQKDAESLYRTSKHFTVNGAVAPVQTAYGRVADWSAGDVIVITPMNEFVKINGVPNTFAVQDTWWTPGTYDNLVLPKGTVLIIKDGSEALKEYANLPGVLIIKSENPYRSSRGVLEELGYQYKAQGTEYSEPNTPEEVFLNESVFAYNIGANSGLHFDSPTMNVGNELSGRLFENEVTGEMTKWSNGDLSKHQRLNTIIDLIKDGYFSHEPINGLYIPPERIPNRLELTTANFNGFTSPLTNSQIKAVEDIISNEKLTLPNYWENQGIATKYQQLIKDSFVDPTLGTGLPLLKPELFGLSNEEATFLRQNVNNLTKSTIPISDIPVIKSEIVVPPPSLTGFAKFQEQIKGIFGGSGTGTNFGDDALLTVGGGTYKSLGGQKLVIDPNKDTSLQKYLITAKDYLYQNRTNDSISRVDLLNEFVYESIRYANPETPWTGPTSLRNDIYNQGTPAYLGQFTDHKTGVCREKAACMHVLLADNGKPSYMTIGEVDSVEGVSANQEGGRHAWVEYIDTKTNQWMVADPTVGFVLPRDKAYQTKYVNVQNVKHEVFVWPESTPLWQRLTKKITAN